MIIYSNIKTHKSISFSGVTITHTFYKTIKNMINDHSIGTFDQVIHFAAMILHKVLRYKLSDYNFHICQNYIKFNLQTNISIFSCTSNAATNYEILLS